MNRRLLVIALVALVAAVLLVPIVMLVLAGSGSSPDQPEASEAAAPAGPLEPSDVGWVYAAQVFDAAMPAYTLQAGTLDAPEPAIDLEVAFAADHEDQVGRSPAVGPVTAGAVVYVADDGVRSTVRRIGVVAGSADEEMAVLDEIVWDVAVAPDATHAYLALVDRADPDRDLGVVRLSLDGRGQLDPVLGPAAAGVPAAVRPVAVLAFDVDLAMSLDGRHLLRRACAGAKGCAESAIDLQTGAVTELAQRRVLGAAGGIVLMQDCTMDCAVELLELSSGVVERLDGIQGEAAMTLLDGTPRVAFVEQTAGGSVLHALDPRDGSRLEILRGRDREQSITLMPPMPDLLISIPAGYVLATVTGDDAGAIVMEHSAAIPLDGGESIELPRPPFRPEFGPPQG